MDKQEILERLKNDEDYYGEFGQQFLSNSNISALLNNPLEFNKPMVKGVPLVVGGYFHTAILEPHKLDNFTISDASSRNSKAYKEAANGDVLLLQKDVDNIEIMKEAILGNELFNELITDGDVEYEVPGLVDLAGGQFKGKADIINHTHKLIIDLKTSGSIDSFAHSAYKFNYDSQAYIYNQMFGYDFIFIVVDKTTHQVGLFDCSDRFLRSGEDKVERAVANYEKFFGAGDYDLKQHYVTKTL